MLYTFNFLKSYSLHLRRYGLRSLNFGKPGICFVFNLRMSISVAFVKRYVYLPSQRLKLKLGYQMGLCSVQNEARTLAQLQEDHHQPSMACSHIQSLNVCMVHVVVVLVFFLV